jgi:hypothetical protein
LSLRLVFRAAALLLVTLLLIACGGSTNHPMPRLAVTFARTPVPIALNSYCWKTDGPGSCADGGSINSAVLARGLDAVRVLPGSVGQLGFDRKPAALDLAAGTDETHLQPVPVSGNYFRAPSEPGRYAFRVLGRWHEGDASWVFVVTVTAA